MAVGWFVAEVLPLKEKTGCPDLGCGSVGRTCLGQARPGSAPSPQSRQARRCRSPGRAPGHGPWAGETAMAAGALGGSWEPRQA